MKSIILLMYLSASMLSFSFGQNAVLSNDDLVTMHEAGLSNDIIVATINSSKVNFDLSAMALVNLKNAGIPNVVIEAMTSKITDDNFSEVPENKVAKDHETGIFCINASGKEIKVEPSVYNKNKSKGWAAQNFTLGIAKTKTRSVLARRSAVVQISNNSPEFYFYFEEKQSSLSYSSDSWHFQMASSPNEFLLVKLEETKNGRELITGQSNNYKRESGVSDKHIVQFNFERIEKGVYRVFTDQSLKPGEYCFFFAGVIPNGGQFSPKVFDFGID